MSCPLCDLLGARRAATGAPRRRPSERPRAGAEGRAEIGARELSSRVWAAKNAERGAVSVEYLVAFLPVMFFFASVWQLADLFAAQLIVQRAASAAGRAACVVLPDDPFYYGGQETHSYSGSRRAQVELAANLVLDASGRILANPSVEVEGHQGIGPLTARVRARFACFPGWGAFVCGPDGERTLTASARFPYHGASYVYP